MSLLESFRTRRVRVSLSDSDGVGGVDRIRPHRAASAAGHRLASDAHLQLAAHRPQDVEELAPELDAHEGVQDGIEAAVEVTNRGCDDPSFVQSRSDSTGVRVVFRVDRFSHERDVVGRPADEKHHHHDHDDPERSLLLQAVAAAPQPPQDAGVAEDQDS